MGLGHEKLDVYRLSIGYVAWVYEKARTFVKIQKRIDSKTSILISIPISKKRGGNQTLHMDLVRLTPHQANELSVRRL